MSNEQILSFVLLGGPNKLRYRFLRIIYENVGTNRFSFLGERKTFKSVRGGGRVLEKLWPVSCFTRKIYERGLKRTNLSGNSSVLREIIRRYNV